MRPDGIKSIPPAKISCITASSSMTSPAADVTEPSAPRTDEEPIARPSVFSGETASHFLRSVVPVSGGFDESLLVGAP